MNFIIDLCILIIIALSTFIGFKKGFIKVAFRLISFILALIIALVLYKPVSNFINNYTPIPNKIESKIESRISSSNKEETNNLVANYYKNIRNISTTVIAKNITNSIVNISSILIVFLLSRLLLMFLRISTDLIAKLPLIKQFNHIGGFIYGLLAGFFIIYLIFTIITLLAPIIDLNNIIKLINSSIIANIMYNNNILFMFFV